MQALILAAGKEMRLRPQTVYARRRYVLGCNRQPLPDYSQTGGAL